MKEMGGRSSVSQTFAVCNEENYTKSFSLLLGWKDTKIRQNSGFHAMATPRVISNILYLLQALRDRNKRNFSGSYKRRVFIHLLYLLQ